MNILYRIIASCIVALLVSATAMAQVPNKWVENFQGKPSSTTQQPTTRINFPHVTNKALTSRVLATATRLVLHDSNGAVAPEFQYSYVISVSASEVTLTTYTQMDSGTTMTSYIPSEMFDAFKAAIAAQKMKLEKNEMYMDGCGETTLEVFAGSNCVFKGSTPNGELKVDKGFVTDNFMEILSTEQRAHLQRVEDDPSGIYTPFEEPSIVDPEIMDPAVEDPAIDIMEYIK